MAFNFKKCLYLFLVSFCIINSAFGEPGVNPRNLASANLALKLLSQSGSKNAFFSPASIAACLSMIHDGAKGQTKEQINKVIFNALPDNSIDDNFRSLSDELKQIPSQYQVNMANRAYVSNSAAILDGYKNKLASKNVSMISTDFTKSEEARRTMNTWVEEQTKQKIKDLLPSGAITPLTVLVLINAIYYKGDWAAPFNESRTREVDFHVSADKKFKVPMMSRLFKDTVYQHNGDDARVLGLPFLNETFLMVFIMPKERFGLSQLEQRLTADNLLGMFSKTRVINSPLMVKVPKFKMTLKLNLKETLINLNVTDMFSQGSADFSPINGARDLYVNDAFHKAAIEVNEKGSEAAAATAVVLVTRSGPPTFSLNEPFLFAILHRATSEILFFGRFADDKFEN